MALDIFYNAIRMDLAMIKGDTMSFGFQMQGLDGSAPSSIIFSCKEDPEDDETVFSSSLEDGGIWLDSEDPETDLQKYGVRIAPSKTENLNTGRYYYDLEITINGGTVNEDVFTLMKGRLQIEYDVTR